jgi:hypothetical protein
MVSVATRVAGKGGWPVGWGAYLADKIVDHDGMMFDEFHNMVSDLGDEMRVEMKELKEELRALVVAKVSAQEKEIRELRDMVLSLAKKVDGGRTTPLPPLPTARKERTESKGSQAPSYAQAAAAKTTTAPAGAPSGPRASQPRPRPAQQGDVELLQRPIRSTIRDSQLMEGVEFSEQGLNASKHAPPTIPLPSSPPPSASAAAEDETAGRSKKKEGGEGLDTSQHATPSTLPPLPPMDPELFRVHPERRKAFGPTGQDEAGERAVADRATETRAAGERDREWTTVGPKGKAQEGRSRKGGRAQGIPTYAQAARPAPPRSSSPPSIITPLPGHARTTTQDSFWIQWIFPAVDDGKVSSEEVKKQLRKNEVTRFLTPGKSEF